MKVLVIGGSGFIGTRLLTLLVQQGHDVRNLDLAPSTTHAPVTTLGDVRVTADVTAAASGVDVVVNLAAEHRDDVQPVERYQTVNVGGAEVVASVASELGITCVLFTSSVAVYGLDVVDPSETTTPAPFNDYGRTKLAAEAVLGAWAAADPARSLTVVRPSVVFGEANRGNVYTLAAQIASGRFLRVGDGSNRKSMAYVGNVAAFLAAQLDAPAGVRTINYTDKPDLTTRELVALVQETLPGAKRVPGSVPLPLGLAVGRAFDRLASVTGRTFPISEVRVRKFCAETTVDATVAEGSGFVRPYAMTEALRRTLTAEFPELVHT